MGPEFPHVPSVIHVRLVFQFDERSSQHRPRHFHFVIPRVNQGRGDENQPLQEILLFPLPEEPQLFQNLVNMPKLPGIKKPAPLIDKDLWIFHSSILALRSSLWKLVRYAHVIY